jgi:UDP-N-acetylglucosamine acyltransferase
VNGAMSRIHPTAVIAPDAELDSTVEVGPYAIIGPEVKIGAHTKIGAHAVLEYVTMGTENKIFPGSHVGTAPQDLKYAGEKTLLFMGNKNTVREGVTINRGTTASGKTVVGSGCLFMMCSHIAHDCVIGDGVILANCVALAGHVHAGDYSVFGGFAGVHQFVHIGKFCMVGAGSMQAKDLPSYCMSQGDRATLRGLNILGMKRAGLSPEARSAIKDAYKELFLSGKTVEDALTRLLAASPLPEVLVMLNDIKNCTKRGITRPATGAAADEEVSL